MARDKFVDIAQGGYGGRKELLHEPAPIAHETKRCLLQEEKEIRPIATVKKMDTAEELFAQLAEMKEKYRPYLADYAPTLRDERKRISLTEFVLNGAENVTLPHYGGPVGNACHTYETEFTLEAVGENKCVYLCVTGADYMAQVYINGCFAGSHEGFFSPFEFEVTELVRKGQNALKIVLKNDYTYRGVENGGTGETLQGDKLYAETGIGWDGAADGWHHCPAGMGLYDKVYVEVRDKLHIHDLFVRPIPSEHRAEAWIEVENTEYVKKDLSILLSVYGQNFKETVFEKEQMKPALAQKGTNLYQFSFPMEEPKLWNPDTPYLYQLHVELVYKEEIVDRGMVTFGMREFTQDLDSEPKGMFYLNGKKIRLRGANTMGFEQLDVMRRDYEQLIDDIFLAKVCHMNFLRITQRPVQKEVYQYCDMLGLMVQTDLPLFGCMRWNKVAEGIRQAEEMERLIRSHASCIIISYINEPEPDEKCEPHRHLERPELEQFFAACNIIVHLNNPDRVIKHVDGDFNPPTEGMPDSHCYTIWYNGHGIDVGKMIKGYWTDVKPGWYYGCGEYGAEGLECAEVMKKYYPKEWLAEPFDPGNIIKAQTKRIHYYFYDSQDNLEDWIRYSQDYQALATRLMTEALRRDNRLISNAIHLFIDAWPSGWMKTIMDCDRNPKPALFAYRDAIEPVKISLRTDRFRYFEGEEIAIEAFLCNDTNVEGDGYTIQFEVYAGQDRFCTGKVTEELLYTGTIPARMKGCEAYYVADACFTIPKVEDRELFTLKAILSDPTGNVVTYDTLTIEVFEDVEVVVNDKVELICDLPVGVHEIAGEKVTVKECGMSPVHFVSRKTGHEIVQGFHEKDFSYWYNRQEDRITPVMYKTFLAEGFTPVLISGNEDSESNSYPALAAAVKVYEGKLYVICMVDLRMEEPVAKRFLKKVYAFAEKADCVKL